MFIALAAQVAANLRHVTRDRPHLPVAAWCRTRERTAAGAASTIARTCRDHAPTAKETEAGDFPWPTGVGPSHDEDTP